VVRTGCRPNRLSHAQTRWRDREWRPTDARLAECQAFAERYVAEGIQFVIEDIMVAGPPWNTRVALCVHDYAPGTDGRDHYNNPAVVILKIRWGRLVRWEDFEDSERVAAWDAVRLSETTQRAALTTA
jgi:ketosteroid isomerase-like protein